MSIIAQQTATKIKSKGRIIFKEYKRENMFIDDYLLRFILKINPVELLLTYVQYENINKNCEKVKFISRMLKTHNVLNDYKSFDKKNNQKSIEFRKIGNSYFSLTHNNYVLALEFYNLSICYAELNTECLATGYANRSAIYYQWELYDECLENIELAFKACTTLPDKLCAKLQNRKTMCLGNIGDKKEEIGVSRPFELSYPPHPRIPFIVDSLKMEQNDQFGRLIKTTRDLYPGDCIIIEPAAAAILTPQQFYKRCAQCLVENNYNLIPCQHCTATMYCSTKCRDTAYTSYHRFECSAITGLITMFGNVELTALNVVLKLFSNVAYLDKTIDYLNNFKKLDPYNFDYKSKYDYADEYKMIHNLVTHELLRRPDEKIKIAFTTAIIYQFLKSNKFLQEIFAKSTPERQYKDLFLTLIYHNLQTSDVNYSGIETLNPGPRYLNQVFGSGIYPFASLINHSCNPNVARSVQHQTLDQIFIVIRNIAKGEQLFMDYGINYSQQPKVVRQHNLQLVYKFKCVCDACELDWPMFYQMKFNPNLPCLITEKVMRELCKQDRAYVTKLKLIITNFLKKYDKYLPAAQIFDARSALQICINILLQQMPLHLKYEI